MATTLAGSIFVAGCADMRTEDVAGALLIGALAVGVGVLLADDSDGDTYDSRRHRHDRHDGYARNGQCDDPSYRTSNGGRASPGTDEHDCRRYGDGRK